MENWRKCGEDVELMLGRADMDLLWSLLRANDLELTFRGADP